MAWKVYPVCEVVFREQPHRLLEIEADSTEAFDVALAQTAAKGWELYAKGRRPDQPKMQVALFLKPI